MDIRRPNPMASDERRRQKLKVESQKFMTKNKKTNLIILSIISLIFISVFIGGNVSAVHTCQCPCVSEETGGLVPCGRYSDNPETSWDERQPCTLCQLFLMLKLILEFLLKLALIIVILFIIISGLLYIFSLGSPEMLTRAKSALTRAIAGFAIIFLAWLVINTVMNVVGWNKGSWHEVACDGGISSFTFSCCGDGKVDKPNSCGCEEMCEPADDFETFKSINASVIQDFDGDGTTGNDVDFIIMKSLCTGNCTLGCYDAPPEDIKKIGLGCYDPDTGNPCQKGKWECDEAAGQVVCMNVYNDPNISDNPDYIGENVFDYCCDTVGNEFKNGSLTEGIDFVKVRATSADLTAGSGKVWDHGNLKWYASTYKCDEVCRKSGKICIGVGLGDSTLNPCISVQHDISSDCDLSGNQASNNCQAHFTLNGGSCTDNTSEHFVIGETFCYCK